MTLTMTIPDSLAASIGSAVDEVHRRFIEGYAVQAYRSGTFSTAEIRELLGHASRWETEDFLAAHGAWPDPSASEVMEDLNNLRALGAA
ncbi:UPF0175 family protein [Prosthecobacter sp.]|jgi:hypothetical protein|uniref:UPF0175 family protein n=1 Tax=Prosthecobacter sp. TaxID=1965333 RepID=UPI0037C657F1